MKSPGLTYTGIPLIDRLLRRITVHPFTGCWLWGGPTQRGYGCIGHEYKTLRTHRVMYEEIVGQIPPRAHVLHKCDTPRCCNPQHLFLGGARENALDASSKRRHFNSKKLVCVNGHPFTEDNTRMYARTNTTQRVCIACEMIKRSA